MLGHNIQAERDRKIQRQLAQKRTAREYQRWAMSNGLSPGEAYRFAPPDVQAGWGLIRSEQKQAQRDAYHRQKESIANRFRVK